MGVECLYAPFVLSMQETLERRGAEFDIVYVNRYYIAERVIDAIRRHAPQAKIVFQNADLHFLREMRAAQQSGDLEQKAAALRTREAELAVIRRVDVTLSYNEVEHAVIMTETDGEAKVAKCPWVVEVTKVVSPFEARSGVAFLGNYKHPPNADAVRFFARDVMPLLRRRIKDVEFLVYGSGIGVDLERELSSYEGVVVKGFVDTVDIVYDTARIFVAPLLSGAGIKGKVIGALAAGVPSVLSPFAAEGTGVRDGGEAMIVISPAEYCEAIATIYADSAKWASMSDAGQSFVAKQFSFERGREMMALALA